MPSRIQQNQSIARLSGEIRSESTDLMIVVGSKNSAHSNRLREVAENLGVPAYLVDNATELEPAWFVGRENIGVTAGASAPEVLVVDVIRRIESLGAKSVREMSGVEESVVFTLPKGLVG